ncbi:hypothetical protein BD626DRAFT_634388 [Schizophyllum amplum]|uniref:Uncharacterized protein n=1 Tax=Schizophyllum amplum TaxID=97359 RepID=A0A550BZP5_9AGAR|nr:hypothetical protein BD626DRAFT_634388 [Auriculariopsis ampla]
MAQPQAPVPPGKPTGTGLFILERDGHRVVVPTPSTYELCIFLCQQNFAKDVPGPHISLYTRELAISPGEPIQITSAAWSRVKGMVNKCEVRLEGDIHERAELGDAGAHSRKRARSRSLSPAPRKRRREDVHSDFVHDNDHSDLESDIARARQRKYWTPRADVELPPAVLTYELLWATKLGPSGQHFCDPHALEPARHFQVQSSRAQLLKDNLKHAVLFYTNFDIKAKGITGPLLTRLIEEQTGMRCAKIKVLEDLATFELRRQKSDTARRLAFVVFESQEQKTRMIAATVYTRGPLLVILREPVAERTAL